MTQCSWSTASDDVKVLIFDLLDYESRCNVRLVSKHDKEVIDSTKFTTGNLKIEKVRRETDPDKPKIRVSLDNCTIWTSGEQFNRPNELERKTSRFLTRLFQKWSVFNSLQLENLHLDCEWTFSVQSLSIRGSFHAISLSWLQHQSAPNYKSLFVGRHFWSSVPLPPNVLNVSEHLHFQIPTTMTDEQLDTVRAVDITLASVNLTSEGVKRLVERHLKFGRRDDKLEVRFAPPDDYFDVIPRGLQLIQLERNYYFEVRITGGFENVHGLQSARRLTMFENGDYTVLDCNID